MARETKVGLLIGLGLILLIGIIVSDHISVMNDPDDPAGLTDFARRAQNSIAPPETAPRRRARANSSRPAQRPPSLTRSPGRLKPIPTAGELRRAAPPTPAPAPAGDRSTPPSPSGQAVPQTPARPTPTPRAPDSSVAPRYPRLPSAIALNDAVEKARPKTGGPSIAAGAEDKTKAADDARADRSASTGPAPAQPGPHDVVHTVRRGETLVGLARRYYDNARYWKSIARANPEAVGDHGQIRAGVRLVIPRRAADRPKDARATLAQAAQRQGVRIEPIPIHRRRIDVTPRGNAARDSASASAPGSPPAITVKKGDTLSGLAKRYLGGTGQWKRLLRANAGQLDKPQDLRPGMTLTLPPGTDSSPTPDAPAPAHTYTVRSGDTLEAIARQRMGDRAKWRALYRANRDKIKDAQDLSIGTELRIPS